MHNSIANLISRTALIGAMSSILMISTQVHADGYDNGRSRNHTFTDYARVVDVQPIYKKIAYERPREECWTEDRQHTTTYEGQAERPFNSSSHNRGHNTGQTVIGGLIGGVIGNKLGSHSGSRNGRIGATVAGAIIGSAIASETTVRHRRRHTTRHREQVIETRPVRRCTTRVETHYEQKLQAYKVTYSYQGKHYKTQMKRHPGQRIPLQVRIEPIRG